MQLPFTDETPHRMAAAFPSVHIGARTDANDQTKDHFSCKTCRILLVLPTDLVSAFLLATNTGSRLPPSLILSPRKKGRPESRNYHLLSSVLIRPVTWVQIAWFNHRTRRPDWNEQAQNKKPMADAITVTVEEP